MTESQSVIMSFHLHFTGAFADGVIIKMEISRMHTVFVEDSRRMCVDHFTCCMYIYTFFPFLERKGRSTLVKMDCNLNIVCVMLQLLHIFFLNARTQ